MLHFIFFHLMLNLVALQPNTNVDVCLSSEEKKLYEIINDYRKKKRLKPIAYSAKLTLVAQTHAKDLADHFQLDNEKCNPHSWSDHGEWTACCYTNDHKAAQCMWDKPTEIAGYRGEGFEIAYYSSAGANAAEGLLGWQKSPSHNPLLINSGMWKDIEWKAIGIGIYKEYGVVWFGRIDDEQNEMGSCF